jgi:hypothetical protein
VEVFDPKNNFSRFDIDSLVRGAQIYDADFATSSGKYSKNLMTLPYCDGFKA